MNHNNSSLASTQSSSEVDQRPLSEYDNLQNIVAINCNGSSNSSTLQTHFPLADIKFRFDDLPQSSSAAGMSSSQQNSSSNNATTSIPSHKPQYENVIDTVQMRNKRENDSSIDQSDGHVLSSQHRPAISEAKSSFFGLHVQQSDDMEMLIEETVNIKVRSNEVQYVNLTNENEDKEQISATSSASGSSSVTATPSSSPIRGERASSRKNSEGSNRSKSPKFILPDMTSNANPSQVSLLHIYKICNYHLISMRVL